MALDLVNGYSRKDSASASNVYYGYSIDASAGDAEKVFAIRKVSTSAGVETVTWANGSPNFYTSNWSGRTYSFSAPGGTLGLTFSTFNGNFKRTATFNWTALNGVSQYLVTSIEQNGKTLQSDGLPLQGQYVNRNWTSNLINLTTYDQSYLNPGTYTFTVTALNVAGSTSSTVTLNFPS